MTTIFTRNLAIFILIAVLLKCIINMHAGDILVYSKTETKIADKSEKAAINFSVNESASERFCLGVNTGFPVSNTSIKKVKNNSVGNVNIIRSYGTYNIQSNIDTLPVSDLISGNKVVIRVGPQLSKMLDKRMQESADIGYILSGTELAEIYSNSNITKIEKVKLGANKGEYYLFELNSDAETNLYGEKYLSQVDKIRRFTNF